MRLGKSLAASVDFYTADMEGERHPQVSENQHSKEFIGPQPILHIYEHSRLINSAEASI